ncbi:hypothetical protein TNCV_862271 [Trichonephila clavipes]|nr:hypothetical protein TNCV_862271 [Trichonephila clavipes]
MEWGAIAYNIQSPPSIDPCHNDSPAIYLNREYLGSFGWRVGHPTSLNELETRLQQIWNEMSQDIIRELVCLNAQSYRIVHSSQSGGSTGLNVQLRGKLLKTTHGTRRYNNNRSVQFQFGVVMLEAVKVAYPFTVSTIPSWKMNFATGTCRWLGRREAVGSDSTVADVC